MPLTDLGGEVEVQIDGDSYWLREFVSWRAREKAGAQKGVVFYVARKDLDDGMINVGRDDMMPVAADATEDVKMIRLKTWLIRWSHVKDNGRPEPINERNLERLPKSHLEALLERILELEEAQDGPHEDSPLGNSAKSSSETP
jgi:hypothetical protein